MSHLSTTILVDAPAEVVYDLLADPARAPDWQTLLSDMGPIAGRPGGIGSSYVGHYRVAGRKLPAQFVVTAAERPTLHQLNGTTTGGWNRWTHLIEPDGDRCRLRISMEYELPGEIVGSLFGMLTGNRIEREFRRSYEQLQRIAEATARSLPPPAMPADDGFAPEDPGRAPAGKPAEAMAG